ncbi:MAG: hypothetical protein AAGA83_17880 [Cyanobacteria bacterium P01_F01_bin.116]
MSTLTMATETHHPLAREYQALSSLTYLKPDQEERLSNILDLAIQDPVLDQCIQAIEVSSIAEHEREHILNQQAKMQEYTDIEATPVIPVEITSQTPEVSIFQ